MPGTHASPAQRGADPLRDRWTGVVATVLRVVDFAFGVLYTSIAFEFVLELLAARDGNAFKTLLDDVTHPFLHPFRTLLPTLSSGGIQIIPSYVVAFVAYAMLQLGLHRLVALLNDVTARPGDD